MADKNIQMRKKNANGTFDNYFPITKAENVIDGARIVTGSKVAKWGTDGDGVLNTVNLGFKPRYVTMFSDYLEGEISNLDNKWLSMLSTDSAVFYTTSQGTMDFNLKITSTGFSFRRKFPDTVHYIAIM